MAQCLHTKLGSTAEIETPVVGTFVSRTNFASFESCKFGNGVFNGTYFNGHIRYAANGASGSQGCAEGWYIVNNQAIVSGHYMSSSPAYRYLFSISDNLGNGISVYIPGNSGTTQVIITGISKMSIGSGFDVNAGVPFHFALVWNLAGIPGSGGETLQAYLNGIKIVGNSNTWTIFTPDRIIIGAYSTGGTYSWSNVGNASYDCAIDNIKVWDYAKTDFTDRNTEMGGQAGKFKFNGIFNKNLKGGLKIC